MNTNMHIVIFKGNLGNQLCQYSLMTLLEDRYGKQNVYANINYCNYSNSNKLINEFYLSDLIDRYIDNIPHNKILINEDSIDSVKTKKNINYVYDGFWNDERYITDRSIKNIKGIIGNNLDNFEQKMLLLIKTKLSVSIHIYRSEFLDDYLYGNISTAQYFINSINFFCKKYNNSIFFVFSDDVDWCKSNLPIDNNFIFIQSNLISNRNELFLMSKCKHNIISNNIVSWWVSRLNENSGFIITPPYWNNETISSYNRIGNHNLISIINVPLYLKHNETVKYSFIIPCFNTGYKLKRCLSSILNQRYENFEIILIEDCSSDNTLDIIKEYDKNDTRINYIKNKTNKGTLSSRIEGMKQSKGDYVLFFDPDDYADENMLNIINGYIKAGCKKAIGFSHIYEPSKRIIEIQECNCNNIPDMILHGDYSPMLVNKCYPINAIKNAIKDISDYYSIFAEDRYLSVAILKYCDGVIAINRPLYHYTDYSGITHKNITSFRHLNKIIISIENVEKNTHELFKNNGKDYGKLINDYKLSDLLILSNIASSKETNRIRRFINLFYIDIRTNSHFLYNYLFMLLKERINFFSND